MVIFTPAGAGLAPAGAVEPQPAAPGPAATASAMERIAFMEDLRSMPAGIVDGPGAGGKRLAGIGGRDSPGRGSPPARGPPDPPSPWIAVPDPRLRRSTRPGGGRTR